MKPTLKPGDILEVTPYGYNDPQEGDVIVFLSNNKTQVTHRIASINKDGILTKGDNNSDTDLFSITKSDISGKVVCA